MTRWGAAVGTIAFRIWAPFALAIGIAMAIFAIYYPARQATLYRESSTQRLGELARVTALGIELALARGRKHGDERQHEREEEARREARAGERRGR